jgi:hypothetical protein
MARFVSRVRLYWKAGVSKKHRNVTSRAVEVVPAVAEIVVVVETAVVGAALMVRGVRGRDSISD